MWALLHDDDDALLADLGRPPSVVQARESLDYWRARRARLSLVRRAARREAEQMIAVWEQRLKAAERAEYGPPLWEPLLLGLRLHHLAPAYRRARRRLRRAAIVAAAVAASVTTAFLGGLAVVVAHLL